MGRVLVIVVTLLAIALLACSKAPTNTVTPGPTVILPAPDDGRPDIPRVNPPADTPDNTQVDGTPKTPPARPVILVPSPRSDLIIPFGAVIGKYYPIVTTEELTLLRHPPVRVSGNLLVGYEETLRFDFGKNSTGRIVFGKDEDTDEIGTFLRFEYDKPIFEYRLKLDRGTFYDLQGRDIQILGHTYTIAEATNTSVDLFGKDVASNLAFTDNKTLVVNSSNRRGAISHVTRDTISFRLLTDGKDTDGDIFLSPGETLSSNVGLKLASDLLDITYKGTQSQDTSRLNIDHVKTGYELTADLEQGSTRIPLADIIGGRLVFGRTTDPLRITPCPSSNTYCIAPDTNLILTTSDGRSYLVQYGGSREKPNETYFTDSRGNQYSYDYIGKPGVNAATNIILGKSSFHVRIGPKDNITGDYNVSVDQGFRNGRAEIVTVDGTIIRIGDVQRNTTMPIEFTFPQQQSLPGLGTTYSTQNNRKLNMSIVYDSGGLLIDGGNLTFSEDRTTKDTLAQTDYGTVIILDKNKRTLPDNRGDEAEIIIPLSQTYGIVSLG